MSERDDTRTHPPQPADTTHSHVAGTDADRTKDFANPSSNLKPAADRYAVPGYEILSPLGRGAMGVVYEARQILLDRAVALKMLPPTTVADPVAATRFFAEAQVVAAVKHPNVVEVYDFGEVNHSPYLTMELLGGGTLAERLKAGPPFSPREAASLIETVARGVAAVHTQDIVHRDLKPANVLFTVGGVPKVTDFGLAKRATSDLTATQAVMGTPSYMAPEQAAGKGKFVGPPADVWALGVMLYELLAGRRPFESADTMSLLTKIINEEPPKLRAVTKGLPRELDVIVAKCLSKEPAGRYATAAELADDLTRFHKGEPIQAKAISAVERVYKWSRRKPALAAAWAMGSLLAILVAIAFILVRDNGIQAQLRNNAETAQQRAEKAEGIARQAKEDITDERERIAYARNVYFAHTAYKDRNYLRADWLLSLCPERLHGWEWRYVHRLCHTDLMTLRGHEGVTSVAFSPDGKLLVTGGYDHVAKVWDAKSGSELFVLRGHKDLITSVAFSPDGSHIVAGGRDHTARVWEAKTGVEVLVLKGHTSEVSSVAFSPDNTRIVTGSSGWHAKVWDAKIGTELLGIVIHSKGTTAGSINADYIRSVAFDANGDHLATGSDDGTVRVWDAKSGKELLTIHAHSKSVQSVEFSPDGSRILTGSMDGTAKIWDAKTRQELVMLTGYGLRGVYSAKFSRDGSRVVTGSADCTIRVWDAGTGKSELTMVGHFVEGEESGVFSVAFSPDGSHVVSASGDGNAKVWDARTFTEHLAIVGHTGIVESVAFSADGARIVTAGDVTARVWDAMKGTELLHLKGHSGGVNCAAFSMDCTRIATGGDDKTVRVWDAKKGTQIHVLKGHTSQVESVAFSPSRTHIASGSADSTVRVWNTVTGTEVFILGGHNKRVTSTVFSPDGTRIVTGSADGTARLWDTNTSKEVLVLRVPVSKNAGSNGVASVAFSPDGSRIITGCWDGSARIWDAKSGEELLLLRDNFFHAVSSAAFNPDGTRIVTCGSDNAVRVWDSRTGSALLALFPGNSVTSVAFSPDGYSIIAGTWDNDAIIWDSRPVNREFKPTSDGKK